MKKSIIIFFVGAVLGAAGGLALGVFVYPFIFLAHVVATESVSNKASRKQVAAHEVLPAKRRGRIQYCKGKLTVYQDLLHLGGDFEVGPGPQYHVYLVAEKNVIPSTAVEKTMFVDLGRLKAFRGSQNYPVPDGV